MFDLLEAESTVRDPIKPLHLPHPLRGEIVMDDVAFKYNPALPEVLHGVSLRSSRVRSSRWSVRPGPARRRSPTCSRDSGT